jgi:hypothetical protein
MARILSTWFSALMFFFIFATNMPLFAEIWYEHSLLVACARFIKQQLTLSPLLFVFQAKVIGFYVMNELRYGGATYVATGRGLPTTRRQFIGKMNKEKWDFQGLYLDYAYIAHYDGMKLLVGAILVRLVGGVSGAGPYVYKLWFMWLSVGMTITSWMFAPFIFNPYQFDWEPFCKDVKAWRAFFTLDEGWIAWYEKTQLKAGQTNRQFRYFFLDITILLGFFFFAAWASAMNMKLFVVSHVLTEYPMAKAMAMTVLVPPVFAALIFIAIFTGINSFLAKRAVAEDDTDTEMLSGSGTDVDKNKRCTPVVFSSIVVTVLMVAEAAWCVHPLLRLGWYNTFIGGMILKYFLAETVLYGFENLIRSHNVNPHKDRCCTQVAVQYVYANRMFRDLMTSTLILVMLFPVVVLTSINSACCPGCDWHQLLLYRDTGHTPRQEAHVFNGRSFGDSPEARELKPTKNRTRAMKMLPPQHVQLLPAPATSPAMPYSYMLPGGV